MSEYTREVLKVVVAKLCQNAGWRRIEGTPLDVMVDILYNYISNISKLTNAYATQFGHTEPNVDELALAFKDMHIDIADLAEYVSNTDSGVALEVPEFPVPKESHGNILGFHEGNV